MQRTHVRIIGILALLLTLVIFGIFLYREYLAGIEPAVSAPPRPIGNLLAQGGSPLAYPQEFELSIFAEGLSEPRVMAFDPGGTMLVSLPPVGRVIALPDTDGDGRADRIVTVADDLHLPHGIAFSCDTACKLYIAEKDRVSVFDYDRENLQALHPVKIADLPGDRGHSTRTLLFLPSPDKDKLLVSVGSSCNACEETDWRRAKILLADTGNGSLRSFASGLRNAVFMRDHPLTGEIWATEMGRDFLGDDLPPDEINIIRDGHDYGWPACYGDNVPDRSFDPGATQDACRDKTPAKIEIQAHSAPLGLDFFPSEGWPESYRHSMLVAYHGSWNRSIPTGYKVVLFRFDTKGNVVDREDFITGWLTDRYSSLGRPVDVRIMPGGIIYISDDKAGVVYRLALKEKYYPH